MYIHIYIYIYVYIYIIYGIQFLYVRMCGNSMFVLLVKKYIIYIHDPESAMNMRELLVYAL